MAKVRIKIFKGSKSGQVEDFSLRDNIDNKAVPNNKRERNELKKRQCDGKLKHTSILAANEYLYQSKDDMEVYKCKFCDGYHLGHSKNSKSNKLKK